MSRKNDRDRELALRWIERFAAGATGERTLGPELSRLKTEHPELVARLERICRGVGLVNTLERYVAPEALDRRVHDELVSGRSIEAMRRLASLHAPAELDARVEEALATAPEADDCGERETASVPAVRSLARLTAPSVLQRLIEEELARPAGARSERFASHLERQRPPSTLEGRVRSAVEAGRRLSLVGLTAAAAVLLGVFAWWQTATPELPRESGYRFKVVRADAGSGHNLARSFFQFGDVTGGTEGR